MADIKISDHELHPIYCRIAIYRAERQQVYLNLEPIRAKLHSMPKCLLLIELIEEQVNRYNAILRQKIGKLKARHNPSGMWWKDRVFAGNPPVESVEQLLREGKSMSEIVDALG